MPNKTNVSTAFVSTIYMQEKLRFLIREAEGLQNLLDSQSTENIADRPNQHSIAKERIAQITAYTDRLKNEVSK